MKHRTSPLRVSRQCPVAHRLQELDEPVPYRKHPLLEPLVLLDERIVETNRDSLASGQLDKADALFDESDARLFTRMRNRHMGILPRKIQDHLVRIGQQAVEIPGRVDESIRERKAILQAIIARGRDRAEWWTQNDIRVMSEQIAQLDTEGSRQFGDSPPRRQKGSEQG